MAIDRRILYWIYGATAILALLATWNQNLAFFAENGGEAGVVLFWQSTFANRASASITVDLLLFAVAAIVWMVVEARRLGIRFVWLYVVLGALIAISFTFPLFLIARERRLQVTASGSAVNLARGEAIGLAVFCAPVVVLAVWSLV